MISERLKKAASLIEKGSIVLDIGTDHGYLPIYLIENNISIKVYASDNKKEPLENAIKNIKKHNLSTKITPVLSDGLKNINFNDFNYVSITGMGGLNIIDIIRNYNFKDDTYLILGAHNKVKELRIYLMENNYKIVDELFIYDENHYYSLIKAIKTTVKVEYSNLELSYGPIILKNKPKELFDFINEKIDKFKTQLSISNNSELKNKINNYMEALNEINLY